MVGLSKGISDRLEADFTIQAKDIMKSTHTSNNWFVTGLHLVNFTLHFYIHSEGLHETWKEKIDIITWLSSDLQKYIARVKVLWNKNETYV